MACLDQDAFVENRYAIGQTPANPTYARASNTTSRSERPVLIPRDHLGDSAVFALFVPVCPDVARLAREAVAMAETDWW